MENPVVGGTSGIPFQARRIGTAAVVEKTAQSGRHSRRTYSLVSSRTDARNVVTSYQYDGLNRTTGLSYTIPQGSGVAAMPNVCTPTGGLPANVCFSYGTSAVSNNNGRLVTMTDPTGSESYTYDQLGRATQVTKNVSSVNYPIQYAYNYAGEISTVTYPSNRQVVQQYDAIGRLSLLQSGGTTYLSNIVYNASSAPTQMDYGNGVRLPWGTTAGCRCSRWATPRAPHSC